MKTTEEYLKKFDEKFVERIPFLSIVDAKADLKQFLTEAMESAREEARALPYKERDMLVSALSKVFPAYLARHPESDKEWEDDWRWIVFIEIPVRTKVVSVYQLNYVPEKHWFKTKTMQVSWHIHDSEKDWFNHLEVKENNWDGHGTKEKYKRLKALT